MSSSQFVNRFSVLLDKPQTVFVLFLQIIPNSCVFFVLVVCNLNKTVFSYFCQLHNKNMNYMESGKLSVVDQLSEVSIQFNLFYLYSAISQQMLSHDTLQIEQVQTRLYVFTETQQNSERERERERERDRQTDRQRDAQQQQQQLRTNQNKSINTGS